MNKFGFLVCILILNLSYEIDFSDETISAIYDKAMLIVKGMSNPKPMNCHSELTLDESKKFIINLVRTIIKEVDQNPGTSIVDIIVGHYLEIYSSLGSELLYDCKIDQILFIFVSLDKFNTRLDLFEMLGNNIAKNLDQFHSASSQIVKTRGFDGKFELVGKIISAITDIFLD